MSDPLARCETCGFHRDTPNHELGCPRGTQERAFGKVREFDTGATRDTEAGKYDFEGFLSPAVLWEFAKYMDAHRVQPDGQVRASDNWQKGIPPDAYMKSLLRHVMDLWMIHRGRKVVRPEDGREVTLDDALGACMFNVQGYWHELLRDG